jgi:hypothetical protein
MRVAIDTAWAGEDKVSMDVVLPLLQRGADINTSTDEDKWSLLMVACGLRNTTSLTVQQLIARGADRFQRDGEGWTALHWAAENDVQAAVAPLLADLTAQQRFDYLNSESTVSVTVRCVAVGIGLRLRLHSRCRCRRLLLLCDYAVLTSVYS